MIKKKSKLQEFLLEYTYNKTLDSINKYYLNNDHVVEDVECENVNEAGGVAAIPIVSDIQKLYSQLNNILEYQDEHSPEVSNSNVKLNFGPIGYKDVKCKEHTIRIKYNDYDLNFKNLIDMPNSVIVFRIKDVQINNPMLAITFKESLGKKNYYAHSINDKISNGKFIKSDPETLSIDVLAVNGEICPKSFYASFFHEFNHLFQDYQQQIKDSRREYVKRYRINSAINLIAKEIELSSEDKRHIINLLSNVMNDTEINAYAAGHFGELLGSEVTLDNYKDFIANDSNVWKHISNVEDAVKYILNFDNEKLRTIYDVIKTTKFDELFSSDYIDENNFKKTFKNNIIKRLQKLINATTRVASYYFGSMAQFSNKKAS